MHSETCILNYINDLTKKSVKNGIICIRGFTYMEKHKYILEKVCRHSGLKQVKTISFPLAPFMILDYNFIWLTLLKYGKQILKEINKSWFKLHHFIIIGTKK